MASSHVRGLVAAAAAASLFMSSTAAFASDRLPAQAQVSPWATLTFLAGGAPAAAVCGATLAATQPTTGCVLPVVDAPPPPPVAPPGPLPPVVGLSPGYGITPLLAGLLAIVGGIGLFLLVKGHGNHGNQANSPG
jgi:hypothetical protein